MLYPYADVILMIEFFLHIGCAEAKKIFTLTVLHTHISQTLTYSGLYNHILGMSKIVLDSYDNQSYQIIG